MVGEMVDTGMPFDFWPSEGVMIVGHHHSQKMSDMHHGIPLTQIMFDDLPYDHEMRKSIDKLRRSLWQEAQE